MSQQNNIEITSTQDALKTIFNLDRFSVTYERWLQFQVKELVEKIVLPKTKQLMRDFRYSQKIIDGTRVGKIEVDADGFVEYEIESELDIDGFDVAKAREEGTKDHFVAPTLKKAMRFIIGSLIGFSKGHFVRGITKSNVIEKSIQITEAQLQVELDKLSDDRLKEMLNQ